MREMKGSGIERIGEVLLHRSIQKLKYATQIMRGKFNHRPRNAPIITMVNIHLCKLVMLRGL